MTQTLNKKKMLDCSRCDRLATPMNYGFRVFHYPKGHKVVVNNLKTNNLNFVTKGSGILRYNNVFTIDVSSDEMVLIPQGSDIVAETLEPTSVVIMRFDSYVSSCNHIDEEDYTPFLSNDGYKLYPTPILSPLHQYLSLLMDIIAKGVDCLYFHDSKRKEFFFYLKAYYTQEQIAKLMYPILSSEFKFKDFIYKNHKKVSSVNDLIDLSNMSRSQFFERFKEEFGMTAKQWMIQRKSEAILLKLTEPEASIKEIMFDFGFNSPSQFNRFCKQYLGDTPSNLVQKNA